MSSVRFASRVIQQFIAAQSAPISTVAQYLLIASCVNGRSVVVLWPPFALRTMKAMSQSASLRTLPYRFWFRISASNLALAAGPTVNTPDSSGAPPRLRNSVTFQSCVQRQARAARDKSPRARQQRLGSCCCL